MDAPGFEPGSSNDLLRPLRALATLPSRSGATCYRAPRGTSTIRSCTSAARPTKPLCLGSYGVSSATEPRSLPRDVAALGSHGERSVVRSVSARDLRGRTGPRHAVSGSRRCRNHFAPVLLSALTWIRTRKATFVESYDLRFIMRASVSSAGFEPARSGLGNRTPFRSASRTAPEFVGAPEWRERDG